MQAGDKETSGMGTRSKGKEPFAITKAIPLMRQAVVPYPKAALNAIKDAGYGSLFAQIIACVISIRTLDELTLPIGLRLFARAASPEAIARLSEQEIAALIAPASFHTTKAKTIRAIALRTVNEFGGQLPADVATLMSLHGIGPKCAHLALGIACGLPVGIGVDTHVHRVTNRWGLVATRNPEQTRVALERTVPREYWIELNEYIVPFGKHICTLRKPRCRECPLLPMCQQVGVVGAKAKA